MKNWKPYSIVFAAYGLIFAGCFASGRIAAGLGMLAGMGIYEAVMRFQK